MSEWYVTRDGICVAYGQVWKDCDRRYDPPRYVKIIALDHVAKKVQVKKCRADGTLSDVPPTKISPSRMHAHSTGYTLVKDYP